MGHYEYGLPEVGGAVVAPDDLDVPLDPGSCGPSQLSRVGDAPRCDASGGWYVAHPANADSITLCPSSCQNER